MPPAAHHRQRLGAPRELLDVAFRSAHLLDLSHRRRNGRPRATKTVDLRDDERRDAQRFRSLEPRLTILVTQVDRERAVAAARERALSEVTPPNGKHAPVIRANAGDDRVRTALDRDPPDLAEHPREARDRDADHRATGD